MPSRTVTIHLHADVTLKIPRSLLASKATGLREANGATDTNAERTRTPQVPPATAPDDGWPRDTVAFGEAVRRARENTDLARDAFAKRVGVCDSTIRNVETARHTCMPKVRNGIVQALANLGQFPQALSGSV